MPIIHLICSVMVNIFLNVVKCVLTFSGHIIDHFDKVSNGLDVNLKDLLNLSGFQIVVIVTFRFQRSPTCFNWILEWIIIVVKLPFVPLVDIRAWFEESLSISWEHILFKFLVSFIDSFFTKKVCWWIPKETAGLRVNVCQSTFHVVFDVGLMVFLIHIFLSEM